jgi:hypothetical protein
MRIDALSVAGEVSSLPLCTFWRKIFGSLSFGDEMEVALYLFYSNFISE